MTYNGWKNYETWNIALWLGNDERLYNLAMAYGKDTDYRWFAENILVLIRKSKETPDGVNWLDETLDYDALDEVLEELG